MSTLNCFNFRKTGRFFFRICYIWRDCHQSPDLYIRQFADLFNQRKCFLHRNTKFRFFFCNVYLDQNGNHPLNLLTFVIDGFCRRRNPRSESVLPCLQCTLLCFFADVRSDAIRDFSEVLRIWCKVPVLCSLRISSVLPPSPPQSWKSVWSC